MPLTRTERNRADGGQRLALAGDIDQDFDLGEDLQRPGITVLDLDGVKRVTSFGVREWIRVVTKAARGTLFLVNCRPALVAQLNMVSGFGGTAEVVSLYMPYICEACDTEFEALLDLRFEHEMARAARTPPMKCPNCNADADFDDVPAAYFSYVASRPEPKLPELATQLIAGAAPPPSLTVQKEVLGDVTGLSFSGHLDQRARLKRSLDGIEGYLLVDPRKIDSHAPGALAKLEAIFDGGADVWIVGLRAIWLDDPSFAPFLQKASGRIIDFVVPVTCARCGESVSGDLQIDDLDDNDSSLARSTTCGRCQSPAVHTMTAANRGTMKALAAPPDKVPQPVRFFLSELHQPRTSVGRHVTKEGSSERPDVKGPRFKILSRVGAGGMAEVFLAEQRGPAGFVKRLVVKKILPSFASNSDFIEMFLNEARVAARINHPNVVQIFDLGEDNGDYFIAMEYVRGWDLSKILTFLRRTTQQAPIELACRIIADVAAGLHAAHVLVDEAGVSYSVVHRDVSPHNVLISVDGAVKITDFGVARVVAANPRTSSGKLKGKIIYMAPEQIDEKLGPIGPQVDVFAAGIVLYELLTHVQPFRRENEQQSVAAVLGAPVVPVEQLRPDVPAELARIVAKVLTRDRAVRYDTADALRQDLERFILGFQKSATVSDFAAWLASLGTMDAAAASGSLPTPGLTPSRVDEAAKTDVPTIESGSQ